MAGEKATTQTFSFETVAALVAALVDKGHTLGMADYTLMAELDGTRSASAFDHQFRKVKARAKELAAKKEGKGTTTPSPAKKTNGKSNGATPGSTGKRGKKNKRTEDAEDEEECPTKKVKQESTEEDEAEEEMFTGGATFNE